MPTDNTHSVPNRVERTLLAIALADEQEVLSRSILAEIFGAELHVPSSYAWQNFVHEGVRELWPKLGAGERLIAYIAAKEQSDLVGDD